MIKGKHEYLAPRFQTALQTSKTFKKIIRWNIHYMSDLLLLLYRKIIQ